MTEHISINYKRLCLNLKKLALFGDCLDDGINRSFGSEADLQAREWLHDLWKNEMGLTLRVDPAANIWAKLPGAEKLPAIAIGSHHDTVKNGGAYDGSVGVLLATEVVYRLIEEKIKTRHPITLVSFTGEEPNSFGFSTLGSKIASGKLSKEKIENAVSSETGEPIKNAFAAAGGSLEQICDAKIEKSQIAAFLECHIEQGRVLDDKGFSLGVVKRITGIYREKIHILGDANHSGTTLLPDRHDALLAASELMLDIERAIRDFNRNDLVGTVGHIEVKPNSTNIIPGDVELIMEIRTPDSELLQNVKDRIETGMKQIIENRGVDIVRRVLLNQPYVEMDSQIISAIKTGAEKISEPCPELTSMAGHDAAHIAKVTRSGMLFMRTPGGHSHCPRERINHEDLKKAGAVLLNAVLSLDKELD